MLSQEPPKQPRVAVIMTTYNGGCFVEQQMRTILAQNNVEVTVFVFDDNSADDTIETIESLQVEFPSKIIVHSPEVNSGGTGKNVFSNLQRVPDDFDFYSLADQDDIWLPEKLSGAIRDLRLSNSGLYFSNLIMFSDENGPFDILRKDQKLSEKDYLLGGGSAGCTYVFSNALFRKLADLVQTTDILASERISHDWLIYFVARHYGYGVHQSADAHILYRIHGQSQYGALSKGGISAVLKKVRLQRAGFLEQQVANALMFARQGSEDEAFLVAFKKSALARARLLLKMNFRLVRKRSRLFSLLIVCIFMFRSFE